MRITSLYGLISFWGLMNFEKEMLNSLETQSIVQFSCRFLPRFQKPLKKEKIFQWQKKKEPVVPAVGSVISHRNFQSQLEQENGHFLVLGKKL